MKKLLTFYFLLFTNVAFADDMCSSIYSNYNVNLKVQPIKYVLNASAQQIKQLSQSIQSTNQPTASSHVIGFLQSDLGFEIVPHYSIMTSRYSREVCSKVTNLNTNIYYTPTIYIATELNDLPCIRQKTIEHENTHYRFQMEALQMMKLTAPMDGKLYFGKTEYGRSTTDIKQIYANKSNQMLYKINNNHIQYVTPRDQILDDPRNTSKELSVCPANELATLNNRLLMVR